MLLTVLIGVHRPDMFEVRREIGRRPDEGRDARRFEALCDLTELLQAALELIEGLKSGKIAGSVPSQSRLG